MASSTATSRIVIAVIILYFLFRQKQPNLETILEKTGRIISQLMVWGRDEYEEEEE